MKTLRSGRTVAVLLASAAALLPLGAMRAQAAPGSAVVSAQPGGHHRPGVQPDFTCSNPGVCVFEGAEFTGTVVDLVPASQGGHWISLTAMGLTLAWGSFNDNSNSSVVFGDQQQHTQCFLPGTRDDWSFLQTWFPNVPGYRYIYIEYGNTLCTGNPPPVP